MLPSVYNKQYKDDVVSSPQRPQLPNLGQQMQANALSQSAPPLGTRPIQKMAPSNGQWGGAPRYLTPEAGAGQAAVRRGLPQLKSSDVTKPYPKPYENPYPQPRPMPSLSAEYGRPGYDGFLPPVFSPSMQALQAMQANQNNLGQLVAQNYSMMRPMFSNQMPWAKDNQYITPIMPGAI